MSPLWRRYRRLLLTGNEQLTVLAELLREGSSPADLSLLAQTDTPLTNPVTPARLAATLPARRAELAVTLPLHFFEVVTLSLAMMPEPAVAKALPYHLAKAVTKPLADYLYDWQITARHRDRYQLTVYLFPAETFANLRRECHRKQIAIVALEPDVFAACGLLEREKRLPGDGALLVVLLWRKQISVAVYEEDRLTLVRSAQLPQPSSVPVPPSPAMDPVVAAAPPDQEDDAVLAGFDIFQEPVAPENAAGESATVTPPGHVSWDNYFHQLHLEILRTQDYHASVAKGGVIRQAVVGGGEPFWPSLEKSWLAGLDLPLTPLLRSPASDKQCPALLQALCLGAGSRW